MTRDKLKVFIGSYAVMTKTDTTNRHIYCCLWWSYQSAHLRITLYIFFGWVLATLVPKVLKGLPKIAEEITTKGIYSLVSIPTSPLRVNLRLTFTHSVE